MGKLVTLLLCLLGLLCTTTTCELAVACRYSFYFFYFPWALLSLRTLGLSSSILFFSKWKPIRLRQSGRINSGRAFFLLWELMYGCTTAARPGRTNKATS